MVRGNPIPCDGALRGGQPEPARADEFAEPALHAVLDVGDAARLRPEVPRIVAGAAELERHEMVVLVGVRGPGVAVGPHARPLLRLGHRLRRPHALGVAAHADRRGERRRPDAGIDRARRAPGVRQYPATRAARVAAPGRWLGLNDGGARGARWQPTAGASVGARRRGHRHRRHHCHAHEPDTPHRTQANRLRGGLTVLPPRFELQSHSLHSDGELDPAGVVAAAAAAGVELLALSDHDSVDGVPEAAAASAQHGIALVPAVEISTLDPGGADLHILGYRIDVTDAALTERLAGSRADRELRAARMAAALEELGYAIDQPFLDARSAEGKTIGRPHLAQAVTRHPDNAARLQAEGLSEPTRFLVEYLIEGRPAFRERDAPTVPEAIALIHAAGGAAVWAHPFWDIESPDGVLAALDRFVAAGLDGVEAFYPAHDRAQTELLVERCAALGLLTTGSSDFHGPGHREFNRFLAYDTFDFTPNLGPIAEAR